jgi:2-iminoacetate synthase ThiH
MTCFVEEENLPHSLTESELENFVSLEWGEIAPRLRTETRDALEKVMASLDGGILTRDECSLLARADGDDLLGLLVAADLVRRELVGNLVTYVVNRNINFTNICFVGCKFCAFSRGPRESDTYFLTLDQVAQKAVEAWELGATEVCIQGGLPHDLPPFYYRDILRAVKRCTGHAHPCFFAHGNRLRRRTHRHGTGGLSQDAARQRSRHLAGNRR